jgi:hypothetical protein
MGAADLGVAQAHIRAYALADKVLPMGKGDVFILAADMPPDFGFISFTEHGAQTTSQNKQRENDKDKF